MNDRIGSANPRIVVCNNKQWLSLLHSENLCYEVCQSNNKFRYILRVLNFIESLKSCRDLIFSLGDCNMEKFRTGIRNILCELDKLKISSGNKHELKECAEAILTLNLDKVRQGSTKSDSVAYDDIVVTLIRFAEVTIDVLQLCHVVSPQYGILCNTVVEVVGYIFIADVASLVLKRFSHTNAIEADFKARCLATSTKVTQGITYMQGLPKPEHLDRSEKQVHLQMMASDVPVHLGLDELLALGVKVTDILKSSDENNFRQLMEKVQLYCCLATFRELFLLYRFAIQSTFEVDAQAVKHVCDSQRTHDEGVLKFLYRPTLKTAKFSCKYRAEDWPVVSSFLDRRGLHAEDLSNLGGAIVQIKSMQYKDRYLSIGRPRFSANDVIRCESNPEEQCTLFQLQGGKDNVFTVYPCVYNTPCHMSDKSTTQLEVSAEKPSPTSGFWRIQKIYSESPNDAPSYMIRLLAEEKRCIYASQINGQVYAKPTTGVGPRYLWQLVEAEYIYFRSIGEF